MSEKIKNLISWFLEIKDWKLVILQKEKISEKLIDDLVWEAVFGEAEDKNIAKWLIWEIAQSMGVRPSSINDLYMARGRGEVPVDFTVPAINIRGISYDMARSIFSTAKKLNVKAFICEIARSEMGYTDQNPDEFTAVILAAALKEKWEGPVFIQGDHYQAKSDLPGVPKDGDIDEIKNLIKTSISAGFYNIDIDMSTLVDLSKTSAQEQQKSNVKYSLELATFVRSIQPENYQISIGCEIGHIGGKNSTASDFHAFMGGLNQGLSIGISKIAVQTGTSHGGVVNPDGSLAEVNVDFSIHSEISKEAREKYQIGGTVQHGASTLSENLFNKFPENQTLEIHLATEFQNIIMDHPDFPSELTEKINEWLDREQLKEKEMGQTNEQFHYKARKKAWGKFKKETWQIDETKKERIRKTLSEKFELLFNKLNVINSDVLIDKFIKVNEVHKNPSDFGLDSLKIGDVGNLSD